MSSDYTVLTHGLRYPPVGSYWADDNQSNLALLDVNRIFVDIIGNRPTPNKGTRFFFSSDTYRFYYDDGSNWLELFSPQSGDAANVMFGTVSTGGLTSPDGVAGSLHVYTGSAGSVTASSNGDELIIEGSTNSVGMSILSPVSAASHIYFGSPAGSTRGLIIYSNTGETMSFYTASNPRLQINSIGTLSTGGLTSPSGVAGSLHVYTGSAGVSPSTNGDELIIEGSTSFVGMSILSPISATSHIYFGSPAGSTRGLISYSNTGDTMHFHTSSNLRLQINSIGTLSTGGLTSPDGVAGSLHVYTGTAGTVTAGSTADDLIVESSSEGGISILTPSNTKSRISFGSPNGNFRGGISYDHALDFMSFFVSGGQYSLGINSAGGIDLGGNGRYLKTKVLDIGDWNMDSTQSVSVAHGVTLGTIRDITVMIRADDDSQYLPLVSSLDATGTTFLGGWVVAGSTNITCARVLSGYFDSTVYDSTSFNRGWIIITYEV